MNLRESNVGTYVSARFSDITLDAINNFIDQHQIPNRVPTDDLHCTIVFSRVEIPYVTVDKLGFITDTVETGIFKTQSGKNALVLKLKNADALKVRHEYANILGATYDFPDYIPHVTISYDIGNIDFPEGLEFHIPVFCGKEVREKLDLNWKPSKK